MDTNTIQQLYQWGSTPPSVDLSDIPNSPNGLTFTQKLGYVAKMLGRGVGATLDDQFARPAARGIAQMMYRMDGGGNPLQPLSPEELSMLSVLSPMSVAGRGVSGTSAGSVLMQDMAEKIPEVSEPIETAAIDAPYHRFTNNTSPDNGSGYMMFADDADDVSHYGKNHYTFDPKDLKPHEVVDAASDEYKNAVYDALEANPDFLEDINNENHGIEGGITPERFAEETNPEDIVDTAQWWDHDKAPEFLYSNVFEPNGWKALTTNNGAIVFDPKIVKSASSLDGQ